MSTKIAALSFVIGGDFLTTASMTQNVIGGGGLTFFNQFPKKYINCYGEDCYIKNQ